MSDLDECQLPIHGVNECGRVLFKIGRIHVVRPSQMLKTQKYSNHISACDQIHKYQ